MHKNKSNDKHIYKTKCLHFYEFMSISMVIFLLSLRLSVNFSLLSVFISSFLLLYIFQFFCFFSKLLAKCTSISKSFTDVIKKDAWCSRWWRIKENWGNCSSKEFEARLHVNSWTQIVLIRFAFKVTRHLTLRC